MTHASVLAHWESGAGVAALSALTLDGGQLVVSRGVDDRGAEMEAACVDGLAELPTTLRRAFVLIADWWYDGPLRLTDGSPSTDDVDGAYVGGWDRVHGRPHGRGEMRWANGITYDGLWKEGVYDGFGTKAYSRGGGYSGMWRAGKREGFGTSLYGGKWGYEKWVGPFADDKPHGMGTMYLRDEATGGAGASVPFEFVRGEPVKA